jgi:hypothetical protein
MTYGVYTIYCMLIKSIFDCETTWLNIGEFDSQIARKLKG